MQRIFDMHMSVRNTEYQIARSTHMTYDGGVLGFQQLESLTQIT